ncbi:MAG: phosphodiesterase [Breznakia sp.]
MKLLIVSDIHGSAYYTKKIIDAFERYKCDKLLLLGDILYHGPRNPLPKEYDPKQVIAYLSPYQDHIIACRGNCDSEVDQMVLPFSITADYQIIPMPKRKLYMSHGHIYHSEHLPYGIQTDDIFLFGHIHIPLMEKRHNIHILNPSSISLPKENNPHTFAILEDDHFTLLDEHDNILRVYPF